MPVDYNLPADPSVSPTEGLDAIAPETPQSTVTAGDVIAAQAGAFTQDVLDWNTRNILRFGFSDPQTGMILTLPQPKVPQAELRQQFPGVKGIDEDLPFGVAQSIEAQQQRHAAQDAASAAYAATGAGFLKRLGVGMVSGLLDPAGDAAFLVPGLGEEHLGLMAGLAVRASESAGLAGRIGASVVKGAVEGGIGGGIIAAGEYGTGGEPDMTLGDAAMQMMTTAALGGVSHPALHFRGDILGERFMETPEGHAAFYNARVSNEATKVAAAQMANDAPIEVRPIFDAYRAEQENDSGARIAAAARATLGVPEENDLLASTALANPAATTPAYWDEAIARATGRPTQEQVLAADMASEARATRPDAVMAGREAEAQRAIDELRASGRLTPEDESELAAYEAGKEELRPVAAEAPPSAKTEEAASGESRQALAPTAAIGDPDAAYAGGLPDVMGDQIKNERASTPPGWEGVEAAATPEGRHEMLGRTLRATLANDVTPEEAKIIGDVHSALERIAPGAEHIPARRLEITSPEGAMGVGGGKTISGYANINSVRQLIAWSLEAVNPEATAKHEAVHFLRNGGFLTDHEWNTLADASEKENWRAEFNIDERYPTGSDELKLEESIADAFARWRQAPAWVPEAARPIFDRVRALLDRLADGLRRVFGADATADDIFSRIQSGEVGARDPGAMSGTEAADAPSVDDMDAAAKARVKLTAMEDLVKRHALFEKIAEIHDGGLSLAHGFDALTRGISEAIPGARDSTAQHQLANQEFLFSRLVSNLEKVPGALEAWRKAALSKEWVRELHELNRQGGKPGVTGSPLALEIAKAVHDAQEIARLNLNRSGAWIGNYDGYISRTLHDAIKIHKAGFDTWRADVMENIDQEKTFEGLAPEEIEDFLHNVWDALSTGIHMASDHGVDPKAPAFPGPGNMGKKVSAGRVLHWKDAGAWMAYQDKYGDPVYERGVMSSLRRAGQDAALMERWGSNPKMAFENLIQQTRQTYRSDHDAVAVLDKALPRIREEFAHLTGEASRPQNMLQSQIAGSIMAMQDITKLGNVLLAHMSVAATKPFQLQYLGVGKWKAYISVLSSLLKDRTPEGLAIAENLRSNATGQFQDMLGGYEARDGTPGKLAKLRSITMRMSGLSQLLARQKAGSMWELANFLGQRLGQTFDQLDERTARGLSIYGISPEEWEVLRTAPDHDRDGSGSSYLTPAAAMRANIDPLVADRLSRASDPDDITRIRDEAANNLAMKLATYYADSADRSTITPGIQERAFFTRHAGRTWGAAVGQYKGWAMAAVRTMWGQAIHGSSRAEAVKSLAELVAVGTAIGYARMAITDAMDGKTPKEPTGDWQHDALLMGQAAIAGGGLGIWGDYLMGQHSRPEESSVDRAKDLAANILGPTFADIARVYGLAERYGAVPFSDDSGASLHKADADAMQFLTSHAPIVNSFYLRHLSQWLILDRLNEMADPGYLERHQEALERDAGQHYFWLPPTQYAGAHA